MTYDELMERLLELLPNATAGEDDDGQLVIYTNLKETPNGNVVDMEEVANDSTD